MRQLLKIKQHRDDQRPMLFVALFPFVTGRAAVTRITDVLIEFGHSETIFALAAPSNEGTEFR